MSYDETFALVVENCCLRDEKPLASRYEFRYVIVIVWSLILKERELFVLSAFEYRLKTGLLIDE
jgi:hypothetical protein